jgi:glycosyltransferase involved in cell wall biosynthesis
MKVSFVIPTYNCVTWLPHAVTSVLQQSHKDVEAVIVDDGSTDRTAEYLKWIEAKEPERVKVLRQANAGRSAARNAGNAAASGEILCVLDADDLATPNRAELTIRKFANSKADFIYGAATVIDAIGNPGMVLMADVFDKEKSISSLTNLIVHSTVAYRKAFAEKYPYRAGEIAELGIDDWAQQVEAAIGGAILDFVPHRLAVYRILTTQVSKVRDNKAVEKAKRTFLDLLQAVPA